ncbi:uncharacterized protein EMH_0001160 [Eimeria mitis]|uniref:DUF4200 domain-containing protein n=1 Tax=Eimeria mitis TaxID=44415 RepID=U6JY04_9EIME|nr:uncharacterized protein EMH_0001160 [Eimeria mitis]CDJ28388.1 hypothetical protein, conserved [Eimeria mitis]
MLRCRSCIAKSSETSRGSEEPQGAPATANAVKDEGSITKGDTVSPPAEGQVAPVPGSHGSSPHPSADAAGSPPAHQESASLGRDPRSQSKQKNTDPSQIRKTLNSTEKRGGTRALVEKTREAFLLQMAIDTRKAEILKLHDRAAEKSEAVRKAESMLTRDAQKFDEFLRSSDAAAHEAIRKADEAARVSQEKATAVRQLRQKLDATKARAASNREKVQEYSRYRAFLTHITPQDWLKDQEELSKERVQQQKQQWVQSQLQQQQLQYAADLEGIDDELREKLQELERKKSRGVKASAGPRKELEERAEKKKKQLSRRLKTAAEFENMFDGRWIVMLDWDITGLAQRFLEELEAMEKRFANTRAEMGARLEGLEAVIAQLQQQLQQQRAKCMQHREELASQEQESDASAALQKLTVHVSAIHAACGFESNRSALICPACRRKEASADCLRMLEQIEARLDSHLAALAKHEGKNPSATSNKCSQ